MTRFALRSTALVAALLSLAACETVKGAGEDIQTAGQVIEGEAAETQSEM
ncbi:entericidin B [Pseudooceanicola antarcticus]|uniref:Entericidin B n=1 Tax=Pseudooceanicola antarcticus TaxID=1247613 RepID=A0A285IIB4_9RHOB|nr:entericidin A/B family lipoprotein [Pseudooceanicola antarcticus]PJE28915.1 entericidin, EcnA/B family [Pseudooceanicola antarcticus]SNY47712.1 entericidin B [Pseudooceanicola antarcticus]